MPTRQRVYLVGIIVLTLLGIVMTVVWKNEPLLGLDLQGGVSVRLRAVDPPDPEEDLLRQSVSVIRNRVDGLGVAEPEISRTSNGVLVQIPGVDAEDQQRALDLVGETAQLRFRPVLGILPPELIPPDDSTTTTVPEVSDTTTTVPEVSDTTTTEPEGDAAGGLDIELASFGQTVDTTTTVPEVSDTTTTVPEVSDTTTTVPDEVVPTTTTPPLPVDDGGITDPADDDKDETVTLPQYDEDGNVVLRYLLGPAPLEGDGVSDAEARFAGGEGWLVVMDLKGGDSGENQFNDLAFQCFGGANPSVCNGQIAITLDGRVLSAPTVQTPNFDGSVQITGNFSESEAKDLALSIRFGSLPIEFERENTELVSATVGKDSLRAGIVAGIVGLVLVTLYMLAYYRIFGLVAIVSLALSGALMWTIIAWLGSTQGLALTLAGVTGIIVSIGVAVDSNIVYFEHLREDVRNGRTVRSAVDRAFPVAFSTIVKADVASLIGAGLLYFLTVGAVRGFALYLGLGTMLDLVATYFFLGPAIRWISRWKSFETNPGRFGVPSPAEGVSA